MMTLKQQLKNVLLVTTLEKQKNCGADAQVVESGCTRSAAAGTLLMVTSLTFAFRCLNFLKMFILVKLNSKLLLMPKILFFLVVQSFMILL